MCHRRPGLKPRVVWLRRRCLMATPAWPTPIREILSKLNSSRPPCSVADSALSCRWPRAAVTRHTTSPRRYFARKLRDWSCGADPTGRESPESLRSSMQVKEKCWSCVVVTVFSRLINFTCRCTQATVFPLPHTPPQSQFLRSHRSSA